MNDIDQLRSLLTLALDEPGASVLVLTHSTASARHLWMTLGRELSGAMTSYQNRLDNGKALIRFTPLHHRNELSGCSFTHIILPESMRDGPAEVLFPRVRDAMQDRAWSSGVYWITKGERE